MAWTGAALAAGLCLLIGCDAFTALGPNGCDKLHPCRNPARPRCDLPTGLCLPAPAAVDGGGDAGPPGPCQVHEDCPSTICDEFGATTALPGQCIAPGDVQTVSNADELWTALPSRHGIRLQPGTYPGNWQFLHSVVLVGPRAINMVPKPPAILAGKDEGPVVRIAEQGRVVLDGLSVREGKGSGGHGVLCDTEDGRLWLRRVQVTANQGRGVWARCPLWMDQSVVGPWLAGDPRGNMDGGVWAESEVSLTNTFIIRNGTAFSSFGGIGLSTTDPDKQVSRLLAQLTLTGNWNSSSGNVINCNNASTEIWDSLIFDNASMPSGSAIIGQCNLHAVATDDMNVPSSAVVVMFDADHPPEFVAAVDHDGTDFHLKPDSPAVDAVPKNEGGPQLDHDFDGDPRPIGKARDFGADEVVLF